MQDANDMNVFLALAVENQVVADWEKSETGHQIGPELPDVWMPREPPAFVFNSIHQLRGSRRITRANVVHDLVSRGKRRL